MRPTDFERSFRFYTESLGLHVYRRWSSGSTRCVDFFLGGGFLELSGSSRTGASENIGPEKKRRAEVCVFAIYAKREPARLDPLDLEAWNFWC